MDSSLRSPRTILWSICLALSLICCGIWSLVPSLQSLGILRLSCFAVLGLSMLGLVFAFPGISVRKSRVLLILAALLLRLALLPASVSDDVNRYLWEGSLVLAGENPYAAAADDPRWMDARDDFWQAMNHHDRPTAYPPGFQWISAATVAVHRQLISFKLLALFGDLTTLALLLALLQRQQLPIRWAGFYAFNPVILIAFAAEAHFDSLMVAALTATLVFESSRLRWLPWLFLGLAVQIKFICLILAPLLITRRLLPGIWAFVLILVLPSLPFLSGLDEWWTGVTTFAGTHIFNGPLLSPLTAMGVSPEFSRTVSLLLFGTVTLTTFVARQRGLPLPDAMLVSLGALLLCSPIVHFWYLSWILPLAAMRPSFGWTVASLTSAGYFIAWHTLSQHGWWGFTHTTASFFWIPVWLAFLAQHRQLPARLLHHLREWSSGPLQTSHSGKIRLGIVIPTLNPGPELNSLVDQLRADAGPDMPIVVADASSPPVELPDLRAELVTAPKGRGNQIAAGIDALGDRADWIAILHADTVPCRKWHHHLTKSIEQHPRSAMLVFGQRFDSSRPATLFIEILNELRFVFGGVAFGDQGMIIRRSALESCGGFPSQPLMEDVEASLRLHTRGRLLYLGREWRVSAAKWRKNIPIRFFSVIRLVAIYQFTRLRGPSAAAECSRKLYRQYYGTG